MAGVNPFLAGIACRCPSCGRGPLYSGVLRVARGCPACGESFDRADSGDGPAVFIILVVGFVCCFGALLTDLALHPPLAFTLGAWVPLAGVLSIFLIRPFKGVLVAVQFHHRAAEARRGGV